MTTDNFCFYLLNRQIQTSQTGGQQYSDTSPFSIPCLHLYAWLLFLYKLKFDRTEENEPARFKPVRLENLSIINVTKWLFKNNFPIAAKQEFSSLV